MALVRNESGTGAACGRPPLRWQRVAALLSVVVAVLLPACDGRQRTNPLDPVNLSEEPNPWRFEALASDRQVTLRWVDLGYQDLTQVIIERHRTTDPDSITTSFNLPLAGNLLLDSELQNGTDYSYRFLPQLAGNSTVAPAGPLTATPGPEICWVANTGSLSSGVRQLAPDGRTTLLTLSGFRNPNDLSVSLANGSVWVADTGHHRVIALDRDGNELARNDEFSSPKAVAALPDGAVWVADEGSYQQNGALVQLDVDGDELLRIDGFARPADVAVRPSDGSVWLSDTGTSTLWHFAAAGDTLLRLTDQNRYRRPLQLDTVDADGSIWLTDDELEIVAHVAADGTELLRLTMAPARPFGIVVDQSSDAVWISLYAAGRVEKRAADGTLLASVEGFTLPLGLAHNPRDGTVWVAAHDRVVKLAADGAELASHSGLAQPYALSLDPGAAVPPPIAP